VKEPGAIKFIREFVGSDEYINNFKRYCLWLNEVEPSEIRKLPLVMERIEKVVKYRASSTKYQTREASKTPTLFAEPRQPKTNYLLIPRVSSENRKYIGYPGQTDHLKPEQIDHPIGWRKLIKLSGEDFQFNADIMI